MIQQMLAIWSMIPLPFLKPAWTSGSLQFVYCWSLAWGILSITLLTCEMSVNCAVVWAFVVVLSLMCVQLFVIQALQHTKLPCPSLSLGVFSNSHQWVGDATQPSHPLSLTFPVLFLVAQCCPTICDPMDWSPQGSLVHGILRQEYWRGLPFPSPMHES